MLDVHVLCWIQLMPQMDTHAVVVCLVVKENTTRSRSLTMSLAQNEDFQHFPKYRLKQEAGICR